MSFFGAYEGWWGEVSDHLGGIYPLYCTDGSNGFSLRIEDIIAGKRAEKMPVEIDYISLVNKICLPYLLGDRTLLKDVKRAPWMAKYQENGHWHNVTLPPHGTSRPDPNEFAENLKKELLREAMAYTSNADTVGILLSGGMDSRIVAGVLRELQLSGAIKAVVAITWGRESSRDVIYSQRISQRFGWDVVHLPINADTLERNINYAGKIGAEVSPLHLHAMPDVSDLTGIDVIVAGSYGDSVGRAEFSGKKVTKLKSIIPPILDQFGLINSEIMAEARYKLKKDVALCSLPYGDMSTLRKREIEQEQHYMRRMLQYCMQVVATNIPLYQMFTAPSVFGLMWDLDPEVRTNEWYSRLLNILPGTLLDIPWARTGIRYDEAKGAPDNHDKRYHSYGSWLRQDLKDIVVNKVNSDEIRSLGVFNGNALDDMIKVWCKSRTHSVNKLDEIVSWLAALQVFISTYHISPPLIVPARSTQDVVRSYFGRAYAEVYVASRNHLR